MTVALITGCSSGFGLLTALELARRGDRVFASMRDLARDDELRTRAADEGLEMEVVQLDVTDAGSVQRAVAGVVDAAGRMDALVNNAGLGRGGPLEEFTDDEIQALFDTNVFGVIRMIREVLPTMRASGSGVIVNVSSIGGLVAPPFFAPYSGTKFALEGITEALGAELVPFGIRVISVCPGAYDTPMADKGMTAAAHGPQSPYAEEFKTVLERHLTAMRAADKPEDVAAAIADAVHDPASPVRIIVPAAMAFIDQARGTTAPDQIRAMLRQNYGLS